MHTTTTPALPPAITPDEARAKQAETRTENVIRTIEYTNNELGRGTREFVASSLDAEAREIIVAHFRAVGWVVDFRDTDGDVTITFAYPPRAPESP